MIKRVNVEQTAAHLMIKLQRMMDVQRIPESLILNALQADYQFVRQGIQDAKWMEAKLTSTNPLKGIQRMRVNAELSVSSRLLVGAMIRYW